jgi:putative endonuclease
VTLSKVEGPNMSRTSERNWYVYIAKSIKTARFYTGISPDPDKRLILHNAGQGAKFARDQGPLEIKYISNSYINKSEARKREIQIKKWRQEKKKWLIEGKIK